MKYPGYLLNPGDMFQVDPERVLFATGAKKDPDTVQDALKPAESEESAEATEEAEPEPEAQAETTPEVEPTPVDEAAAAKSQAAELRSLRDRVKDFLKTSFGDLSVKQKQSLRALSKDIKAAASRAGKGHSEDVEGLTTLFSQLGVGPSKSDDKQIDHDPDAKDEDGLTKLERERLSELLAEEAENPWDPSKPYATPWRPRPFMAPFMFIPRYLEVNQKICSAVYLRHPVARAGRSEIPTPWGKDIMQLSHNWYLRRH
jgi:ribosomal protein S4